MAFVSAALCAYQDRSEILGDCARRVKRGVLLADNNS
jgi:hypothetical protein